MLKCHRLLIELYVVNGDLRDYTFCHSMQLSKAIDKLMENVYARMRIGGELRKDIVFNVELKRR
jgi:hypothetical protein